ncbi:MAG: hypothetical protein ACP5UH_01960 [Candidatus Micrarchaeia archaeon]
MRDYKWLDIYPPFDAKIAAFLQGKCKHAYLEAYRRETHVMELLGIAFPQTTGPLGYGNIYTEEGNDLHFDLFAEKNAAMPRKAHAAVILKKTKRIKGFPETGCCRVRILRQALI